MGERRFSPLVYTSGIGSHNLVGCMVADMVLESFDLADHFALAWVEALGLVVEKVALD